MTKVQEFDDNVFIMKLPKFRTTMEIYYLLTTYCEESCNNSTKKIQNKINKVLDCMSV
jgi:hypothetical protein